MNSNIRIFVNHSSMPCSGVAHYDAVLDEERLAKTTLEGEFWSAKPYAEAGAQIYRAPEAKAPWIVSFSPEGGTMWEKGCFEGYSVLLVMSEFANLDYLNYLRSIGVSYITIGKEELRQTAGMPKGFMSMQGPAIDRQEALAIMSAEFGISSLLMQNPSSEWAAVLSMHEEHPQTEEGTPFYF